MEHMAWKGRMLENVTINTQSSVRIVGKPQDADVFRANVDKNIRVILKLAF